MNCPHTGLPRYCCAHCTMGFLNRVDSGGRRKPAEDETPYYGMGSANMQRAAREGESTGKTLRPIFGGK